MSTFGPYGVSDSIKVEFFFVKHFGVLFLGCTAESRINNKILNYPKICEQFCKQKIEGFEPNFDPLYSAYFLLTTLKIFERLRNYLPKRCVSHKTIKNSSKRNNFLLQVIKVSYKSSVNLSCKKNPPFFKQIASEVVSWQQETYFLLSCINISYLPLLAERYAAVMKCHFRGSHII